MKLRWTMAHGLSVDYRTTIESSLTVFVWQKQCNLARIAAAKKRLMKLNK